MSESVEALRARIEALENLIKDMEKLPENAGKVIRIEKQVPVPPSDYVIIKKEVEVLRRDHKIWSAFLNNSKSSSFEEKVKKFDKDIRNGLEEIAKEFMLVGCCEESRFWWLQLIDSFKEKAGEMEEYLSNSEE